MWKTGLPDPERGAVVRDMGRVMPGGHLGGLGIAHAFAVTEGEALVLHLIDVALRGRPLFGRHAGLVVALLLLHAGAEGCGEKEEGDVAWFHRQ